MNDSKRRINKDVKRILAHHTHQEEQAFKGTIKEGFERRFTIVNERDFQKYVYESAQDDFIRVVNLVADYIENGRIEDGKKPYNNYMVINLDEPYVDEVIEIMKRHGHWKQDAKR